MSEEHSPQLHDQLRHLLPKAHAETCQVVATFLDIRGFSSFSVSGESFDAAVYLRIVFSTTLTDYFPEADFFKPTGDGLMLIHCIPSQTREEVPFIVDSILERSIELVRNFGTLTSNDYMVNFPVPTLLGIGIARGPATRLVSDDHVLDYTGRCLNLAARLMDKARPSGVVFHDLHADQLMRPETSSFFIPDRVCIRGISEKEPIAIRITEEVEIRPSDREAPPESTNRWGTASKLTLGEVRSSSTHAFYLPRHPQSYESVHVHVECPLFDDKERPTGFVTTMIVDGVLQESPSGILVRIPMEMVIGRLSSIPASSQGFWGTKATKVTFTPFLTPTT